MNKIEMVEKTCSIKDVISTCQLSLSLLFFQKIIVHIINLNCSVIKFILHLHCLSSSLLSSLFLNQFLIFRDISTWKRGKFSFIIIFHLFTYWKKETYPCQERSSSECGSCFLLARFQLREMQNPFALLFICVRRHDERWLGDFF